MEIGVALLILMLSYNAESKWEHNFENRYKFNSVETGQAQPTYKKESHTAKIKSLHYGHHRQRAYNQQLEGHSNSPSLTVDPPNHNDLIPMARYVVHHADWASIATISTLPTIEGFPFSNVKSLVDGYIANSTGIPYFYMSPLDFTARDLKRNSRATVLATLEETKFCDQKDYDPQDPRCTRVMLSGKIKKLKENSTEYLFAKGAMFERHPAMASYPADHNFFIAKLKIAQIAMVDWFGGAKYIPVRGYLAFSYTQSSLSSTKPLSNSSFE